MLKTARSEQSHQGYFGVHWPHWSTSTYMLVLAYRRIPPFTAGILFLQLAYPAGAAALTTNLQPRPVGR